jgi:two-component system cell cycle sensor histidine kinase/response regulator CckA
VHIDASQLEQVLVNLVTNARDAMPGGGKITVETAEVVVGDGGPNREPGRYAALSVSDTGTGMDAETQRRAFEPFFTTKALGRGTGLGLATVHGIVHQSGGHVSVQSEAGRGTRFEILLPLVDEAHVETPVARLTPPQTIAPATILVAEDEALVRSVIALSLQSQGHRVLAAKDGEEALAILQAESTIDLVITDVVMARMGGPELARRARELRPSVRLLFISGYSWESDLPDDSVEVLEKPFTTEQLLQRVAAVLGRNRQSTVASRQL